ncbi:MAG: 5'-nucleotidase C-terminal domain-containing protein [Chitinophagaceae bacterium]
MFKTYYLLPLVVMMGTLSCKTSYRTGSLQYKDYQVSATQPKDSLLQAILKPYSDSVNKSMNDVVGVADQSIDKKPMGGPLGYFMVDAFLAMAAEKYHTPIDLAVMNTGGIRLTQLPSGNVTRGKIFELMPFDNMVVVQKMTGAVLQQFLDLTAEREGWPLANVTMEIKDKKAINIKIGGKPLDPGKTYTVANSDFIANGGDNADMLRTLPQQSMGYLMRDALIDYIQYLKKQGKNISPSNENRISNVQ